MEEKKLIKEIEIGQNLIVKVFLHKKELLFDIGVYYSKSRDYYYSLEKYL